MFTRPGFCTIVWLKRGRHIHTRPQYGFHNPWGRERWGRREALKLFNSENCLIAFQLLDAWISLHRDMFVRCERFWPTHTYLLVIIAFSQFYTLQIQAIWSYCIIIVLTKCICTLIIAIYCMHIKWTSFVRWHHIFQIHSVCNVFIPNACMSGCRIILNVTFLVAI